MVSKRHGVLLGGYGVVWRNADLARVYAGL